MVYIIFVLAAVITVLAAIELSNNADVLSGKTALGGLLVGTLLLGGATSLPEVTTSVTSVLIANPDIAVGNMLGSNMFNIFIIACFDIYYRKNRLYQKASHGHIYIAGLGLVLSLMTLAALERKMSLMVLGVGLDSVMIAVVYAIGIYVISKWSKESSDRPQGISNWEKEAIVKSPTKTVPRAAISFFMAAIIIMGSGTLLSISGDAIADITGLGSTFIGSFLMAATTSLPEAVAVFIALRLRNINIAIGSILGSNIFNVLILVGSDIFYSGPILASVEASHKITATTVTLLSVLIISSLVNKKGKSTFSYIWPSILIVIGYILATYLLLNG